MQLIIHEERKYSSVRKWLKEHWRKRNYSNCWMCSWQKLDWARKTVCLSVMTVHDWWWATRVELLQGYKLSTWTLWQCNNYMLHCQVLVSKSIAPELQSLLNTVVTTVNFVKSQALETWLLGQFCKEMGEHHNALQQECELHSKISKFVKDFFSYTKPDVTVEICLCGGHFQFTWQTQPVYPYWKSLLKNWDTVWRRTMIQDSKNCINLREILFCLITT